METGLEDEIEDKTEAENDPEVKNMAPGNREKAPPLIFGSSRKGFHIDRGDFGELRKKRGYFGGRGSPIDNDFWGTPRSSTWGRPYADKYFTPNISRPSNADTSRPATSLNTENAENKNDINPTQEDAQPVRTAHLGQKIPEN